MPINFVKYFTIRQVCARLVVTKQREVMANLMNDEDLMKMAIGQILRGLLDAAGKTAVWLAGESGVPTATVNRLVSGKGTPNLYNLHKLARALKMGVADFVRLVEESLDVSDQIAGEHVGETTGVTSAWPGFAAATSVGLGVGVLGLAIAKLLKDR